MISYNYSLLVNILATFGTMNNFISVAIPFVLWKELEIVLQSSHMCYFIWPNKNNKKQINYFWT